MAGPSAARIIVLANSASGAGGAAEERTRAVLDAFAATGMTPEVRCVAGPELGRVARQLAAEGPRAIVAAGGDGTVSAVAGALVGSEVPMGVLPLGTLNHFAKDVGLPLDPARAAAVVARGVDRYVDVARVNGHIFVNNSSIGLYPHVVRAREAKRAEEGASKRAATVRSAWEVMQNAPATRLVLSVDGRTEHIETSLLFIGNNAYAFEGLAMGKRETLDGGTLTVAHTRRAGRRAMAMLALRAMLGALDGSRNITRMEARVVRVDASLALLRVALDGEVVDLRPPLEYRVLPRALRVLVPAGPP